MKIGLLHSLIRKEEKLLIEAFRNAGVEPVMIDDRKLILDFHSAPDIDILVERSINHSRALHALRLFESAGIPCVNSHHVSQICGDKLLTTAALKDRGIAQPECRVAFTEESALEAIEELGYPVVLKPAVVSIPVFSLTSPCWACSRPHFPATRRRPQSSSSSITPIAGCPDSPIPRPKRLSPSGLGLNLTRLRRQWR